MQSYPIKFEPILKEKIWGGTKLQTVLNKKTTSDHVGESWEISSVAGSESIVCNGIYKGIAITELLEQYGAAFVGQENYAQFGNQFPLLIKFLDAQTNLSVQVHPDDEMARSEHNSFGKTEMWYIMDHDEDAEIILGLKDQSADKEILKKVDCTNVYDVFNSEKVSKGDAYFIPAGKVHAIGAGVLAAEIQQTSDITYRVYDWDRTDEQGQSRELHLEQSVMATKTFEDTCKSVINTQKNTPATVVDCDYFTTNILEIQTAYERDYASLDSFVILMCVEGCASVTTDGRTEIICKGETLMLPATTESASFFAKDARFLEVYVVL